MHNFSKEQPLKTEESGGREKEEKRESEKVKEGNFTMLLSNSRRIRDSWGRIDGVHRESFVCKKS